MTTNRLQQLTRCPWTFLICALAILATTTAWQGWLVADVHLMVSGEPWRMLTGPLVHANLALLARDLVAFLALGALYEPVFGRRWPLLIAFALAVPTICVFAFHHELVVYYGLSGAVHAMFSAALVYEWQKSDGRPPWYLWPAALALATKLVIEMATGSLLIPLSLGSSVRPMPSAHLAGALAGIGAALICAKPHPTPRTATST
jgi:rhomboid family GlyGly-CTERM serine protease